MLRFVLVMCGLFAMYTLAVTSWVVGHELVVVARKILAMESAIDTPAFWDRYLELKAAQEHERRVVRRWAPWLNRLVKE